MKKKTPKNRKLTLTILLAGGTAIILLVNILLINLAYRTILQKRYLEVVKEQLTDACEKMTDAGFDSVALDAVEDDGILILVYDTDSETLLFDSRDHSAGNVPSGSTTQVPSANPHRKAVARLLSRINQNLPDGNGTFFNDSRPDFAPEEDSSQEVTLYGRQDSICFSLSCIVAPLSTAMELAIRLASYISFSVWVISLVLIIFIAQRVVKSAREMSDTAQKIASLDFSKRCRPTITREITTVADSINAMSDQLQENITKLQDTNEQLVDELYERERQQKLSTELISNLSHDLKTPLAIVSGYAEGLSDGIAKTPEQIDRYSTTIFKETEHMQVIVSKLLAMSRLDAGETPLLPILFDVRELTDDIVQSFRLEIEKEGLEVTFTGKDALEICSDYECIRQVLTNYIQNSIYHINGGNQIRIRLCKDAHYGEIAIANSSAPFSEQALKQLWNKLYRGDRARQRKHGEIGLGLSIVKGNMERLGQPYGVRNLEDEGMVEFYIRLPLAETEEEDSL